MKGWCGVNKTLHEAPLFRLVKTRLHEGRTMRERVERLRWRRKRSGGKGEVEVATLEVAS